jgi:hypothetical protein
MRYYRTNSRFTDVADGILGKQARTSIYRRQTPTLKRSMPHFLAQKCPALSRKEVIAFKIVGLRECRPSLE